MWHVCALGWMAPCLSYDVPTRCPSYFWWIMIQTARIWSDPAATPPWEPGMNKVSMEVGKSDQYKSMPSKVSIVGPVHTLHQRHVTTLPHIHSGPSFDPSSHSTDGYSQTCMYLEMLNCIPLYTPRISTSFVGFYMFLQFYMFTWLRPFFHCSTSTASGVDSVPRIFSSWEVNTWWRDMHSDWIWLAQEALRGACPKHHGRLSEDNAKPQKTPREIATSLKFVRYINVVPSFYNIVQSSLASTFGAPLEGQMRFHLPMLPSEMLMQHWCKCNPVTRRWSNTTGRWPRSGTSRWKRWNSPMSSKLWWILSGLNATAWEARSVHSLLSINQSINVNQPIYLLYPSIHPSIRPSIHPSIHPDQLSQIHSLS